MQSDQFALHCDIELRHWWFVARRKIISDLVRNLVPPNEDTRKQSTIIDVGCGTGANVAALAGDYHCVGIDTSAQAIGMAAERFTDVDFRAGFAPDDLGDCMHEARLVMLNDVLEHVPDDFRLLSSILAATSPGTFFVITVPANMALWSEHDESFGHYRRYDQRRFARLWDGLPVEPLMVSYFNARLYPIIRTIRWWNRRRGQASGRAGTDFNMPNSLLNHTLKRILYGEGRRLRHVLEGDRSRGFGAGVSLIAVLRRGAGRIEICDKPGDVAVDYFDPACTV